MNNLLLCCSPRRIVSSSKKKTLKDPRFRGDRVQGDNLEIGFDSSSPNRICYLLFTFYYLLFTICFLTVPASFLHFGCSAQAQESFYNSQRQAFYLLFSYTLRRGCPTHLVHQGIALRLI